MDTATMPSEGTTGARVLLTVEAAAKQLSIGRTTMYALIKAGHIATVRIGQLRLCRPPHSRPTSSSSAPTRTLPDH
jgi:excisionase family DNA binding protein